MAHTTTNFEITLFNKFAHISNLHQKLTCSLHRIALTVLMTDAHHAHCIKVHNLSFQRVLVDSYCDKLFVRKLTLK